MDDKFIIVIDRGNEDMPEVIDGNGTYDSTKKYAEETYGDEKYTIYEKRD